MILWQWLGKDGDANVFDTVITGTGQSGTTALNTTASEVLTHAQSLKITQQTSSAGGNVRARKYMPIPLGVTKFRASMTYRVMNDDADFVLIRFTCSVYDGTNYLGFFMEQYSNEGATELIEYGNSAGTRSDTTFAYPTDQGTGTFQWHTFVMEIDIAAVTYRKFAYDAEFNITGIAGQTLAYNSYPCLFTEVQLNGKTTAIEMQVDSLIIEALE